MSENHLNSKKALKDIVRVSASNVVSLFSGVLVGFLLPKIIGVTDYGLYKTFTLYATYVGLFHFGLSDGIYIKYGGKEYEGLNKEQFRFYTWVYASLEIIISILLAVIAFTSLKGEMRFIFACLSVYLFVHNITSYFQMISQITCRFKELSNMTLIQSILSAITILVLWGIHYLSNDIGGYRTYTILYLTIASALAVWYLVTYKEIVFGKINDQWCDIPVFVKVGFPLMVSNLCASLILTLDRQFVNVLFDKDTYAVYAFAYNMLALVTTATSAISTVMYPNLKRINPEYLKSNYSVLITLVSTLVSFCLLVFFPLGIFVEWFLPKYSESLIIFRIIFPGLAISSSITIVMQNYYKAIGITFRYFKKNVVVLAFSALTNWIAYSLFHNTISISIASIIAMIFWYIYVEMYFIREYNVKWINNFLYILSVMVCFYVATIIRNYYISFAVYLTAIITITYFMNRNVLAKAFRIIKNQ